MSIDKVLLICESLIKHVFSRLSLAIRPNNKTQNIDLRLVDLYNIGVRLHLEEGAAGVEFEVA